MSKVDCRKMLRDSEQQIIDAEKLIRSNTKKIADSGERIGKLTEKLNLTLGKLDAFSAAKVDRLSEGLDCRDLASACKETQVDIDELKDTLNGLKTLTARLQSEILDAELARRRANVQKIDSDLIEISRKINGHFEELAKIFPEFIELSSARQTGALNCTHPRNPVEPPRPVIYFGDELGQNITPNLSKIYIRDEFDKSENPRPYDCFWFNRNALDHRLLIDAQNKYAQSEAGQRERQAHLDYQEQKRLANDPEYQAKLARKKSEALEKAEAAERAALTSGDHNAHMLAAARLTIEQRKDEMGIL